MWCWPNNDCYISFWWRWCYWKNCCSGYFRIQFLMSTWQEKLVELLELNGKQTALLQHLVTKVELIDQRTVQNTELLKSHDRDIERIKRYIWVAIGAIVAVES